MLDYYPPDKCVKFASNLQRSEPSCSQLQTLNALLLATHTLCMAGFATYASRATP